MAKQSNRRDWNFWWYRWDASTQPTSGSLLVWDNEHPYCLSHCSSSILLLAAKTSLTDAHWIFQKLLSPIKGSELSQSHTVCYKSPSGDLRLFLKIPHPSLQSPWSSPFHQPHLSTSVLSPSWFCIWCSTYLFQTEFSSHHLPIPTLFWTSVDAGLNARSSAWLSTLLCVNALNPWSPAKWLLSCFRTRRLKRLPGPSWA